MAISKRLKAIAKYIEGYDSLADIACDHGYLGIYAVEEYNLKEVLLTCDSSNIGSKKIIIKNNGIFHSKINGKDEDIERYWIKVC